MAVNRQKLKLLYLMRMLEEETDSEQGLTMAQILEKLEEQGISAERKSIYRDIEALRARYPFPVQAGRCASLVWTSARISALRSNTR